MSTTYRITLRCTDCATQWKRTVTDPNEPDPPCPNCAKATNNIGLDVAAGRAPAMGGNLAVKAMDFTLESVAAEYQMTDLSTSAREGESMAPKLPAQQQAAADAMFNPLKRASMLGASQRKLNQIASLAKAGAYNNTAHRAPDPVTFAQQGRERGASPVRANYVAGDGVR
jgi:hypothetical protein